MTVKRSLATIFALSMIFASVSCGNDTPEADSSTGSQKSESKDENNTVRHFSGVYSARLQTVSEGNDIQQLIAEKTGVILDQQFIADQDDIDKTFSDMIISNKYSDYMAPDGENAQKLIKEGAFIPLDNYWDDYPNIKNLYTEKEWNRVRSNSSDGHIYYIPLFSAVNIKDTKPTYSGEAFWIQTKVLEWDNYPELKTLDDYFDLIERYMEANPVNEDGEKYYGYEIEANDAWFFALDNPPMFLDGYPNDGCCKVDTQKLEAIDYNLSPTAEKWFRKLNEEYQKGVIDSECFLMNSDQYYSKIASGRVLGMVDQAWNFNSAAKGLPDECTYIPFGLTIDEDITEHYRDQTAFNDSTGVGISISCDDPEAAMKFLSDLLEPEIHNLRFWGIEGEDYTVDSDGVFHQSDQQFENSNNAEYKLSHFCIYDYMPQIQGMAPDGINAYTPSNQPNIFYDHLSEDVRKCFKAYGVQTFSEMLNEPQENPDWYPMWSFSNAATDETDYGKVMKQMDTAKHQYLPLVVMSEDFDSAWETYKEEYGKINTQLFFDELTAEIHRRCEEY
ncbi:MAG: sugar ABC transporter substrate-binding protein [Ruminococcus sp.]|nr:sugar ABC transporter substrate-binding protein [Ruminococcus sp.]